MNFAEERDKVFIDAVVNDNWDGVKEYSERYNIPMPVNEAILKAGIYKAVQECTNISKEVKALAIEKCLKLGFMPFIKW